MSDPEKRHHLLDDLTDAAAGASGAAPLEAEEITDMEIEEEEER